MFSRSSKSSRSGSSKKPSKDTGRSSKKGEKRDDKRDRKNDNKSQSSEKVEQTYLTIYAAIYLPGDGSYYHWSFVLYDHNAVSEDQAWHIYEVVQAAVDGPYQPNYLARNPRSSVRLQDLIPMGTVPSDYFVYIEEAIRNVNTTPADQRTLSWNCQDYVMDVYNQIYEAGVVTQEEYDAANVALGQFYGQDFGGQQQDEDVEEEEEEEEPSRSQFLSDEFVYDSEES